MYLTALVRFFYITVMSAIKSSVVRHSVMYLFKRGWKCGLRAGDLGKDAGGASCPDERFGIDVVIGNVQADRQLQLCHAGEAVSPNSLVSDVPEEALDHVQLRRTSRGEVPL